MGSGIASCVSVRTLHTQGTVSSRRTPLPLMGYTGNPETPNHFRKECLKEMQIKLGQMKAEKTQDKSLLESAQPVRGRSAEKVNFEMGLDGGRELGCKGGEEGQTEETSCVWETRDSSLPGECGAEGRA